MIVVIGDGDDEGFWAGGSRGSEREGGAGERRGQRGGKRWRTARKKREEEAARQKEERCELRMILAEGSSSIFQTIRDLPPGYYQYKFFVDGVWGFDERRACAQDE
ncbi:hypothetical protein LguiB_032130 [Lonicera macranthoides]